MVSQVTIDKINNATDIVEIIGAHVSLKRAGNGYTGCCPFHNENTPSFHVHQAKRFYKCFGCGKSGDVINFIMEYNRLSFVEAVESLASKSGIDVEYDRSYTKEELQEKKEARKEIESLLQFAADKYHKLLMEDAKDSDVWQALYSRGIYEDTVIRWRLGYAPNAWKTLTDTIVNNGWYRPAIDIGLIKEQDKRIYDMYRNRIIIPSRNHQGILNGFIGRMIGDDKPKYINPSESSFYNKKYEVFGLHAAAPAIRELEYCYLVEGNLDVIMLSVNGIENVVAPGGTALTQEQVSIIKRHTKHVVLMPDGDTAGWTAAEKQIDLLVANGFRVDIVDLPWSQDPDSWVRNIKTKSNITT